MKDIKIGVIGCGYWGPNFVRNFAKLKGVSVKYACDSSPERLSHIKALFPHITAVRNYSTVLKDRQVDAVVIATPAQAHYKLVKEALLNGKHVLVEKPVTVELKDARELIGLAAAKKKTLMVGHTFMYNAAVNKIKEILDNKELGRVYYIHSRRTNLGPLRKDVNAVWDLSPHDISIVTYLLGALPLEVSAYAQKFLSHKLEDVGFIILRYPRNVLVHIHVSWLDPKKIREMTIIGSRKMLVYEDTDPASPIRICDKGVMKKKYEKEYHTFRQFQLIIRDGLVSTPAVPQDEPLKRECRHFIDCLKFKRKPLSDGENGLQVLRVLEAINRSLIKRGAFVKL